MPSSKSLARRRKWQSVFAYATLIGIAGVFVLRIKRDWPEAFETFPPRFDDEVIVASIALASLSASALLVLIEPRVLKFSPSDHGDLKWMAIALTFTPAAAGLVLLNVNWVVTTVVGVFCLGLVVTAYRLRHDDDPNDSSNAALRARVDALAHALRLEQSRNASLQHVLAELTKQRAMQVCPHCMNGTQPAAPAAQTRSARGRTPSTFPAQTRGRPGRH